MCVRVCACVCVLLSFPSSSPPHLPPLLCYLCILSSPYHVHISSPLFSPLRSPLVSSSHLLSFPFLSFPFLSFPFLSFPHFSFDLFQTLILLLTSFLSHPSPPFCTLIFFSLFLPSFLLLPPPFLLPHLFISPLLSVFPCSLICSFLFALLTLPVLHVIFYSTVFSPSTSFLTSSPQIASCLHLPRSFSPLIFIFVRQTFQTPPVVSEVSFYVGLTILATISTILGRKKKYAQCGCRCSGR